MEKLTIASNEYLPLRDVVFNTLRDAILTGKLSPGERLMENHLAEQLGVSRTPIREALRMLEQEKLVELVPRKGAQVLDMSEKEIVDILEIRSVLEGLATSLACRKMTDEDLQQLREMEAKFEEKLWAKEYAAAADADESFHDIIFRAAGNERLEQISQHLRIQLYRYRLTHVKNESSGSILSTHHKSIIRAIEVRDSEEGERLAQTHIKYHTEFILYSVRQKGETKD